jgi:O-antigen ligase
MLMIIGIYGFFKVKSKGQYVAVGLACGLLLWGGVVAVSPMLPPGMQRAVSFVPGATVDYRTALDAQNSIDWRVEIWNYALERAPQYLLVGRGGAFDVLETVEQLSVMDPYGTPWQAFLTHTYHSGPIEMLVDYGIPGLIAVLWIHILIFRRMWRLSIRLAPLNTPVSRYLSYLCASQLWAAVAFYLVYGDMTGFTSWLVQAGIIMVLANSVLDRCAKHPALDVSLSGDSSDLSAEAQRAKENGTKRRLPGGRI